ncbi:MAG: NAD(P)H-dependent oxidoreductase [Deltaproteobacteria bacterium]|nr:NAD(P)H-dependent oxidoreductase [Deltaproteobacteria bacterium]
MAPKTLIVQYLPSGPYSNTLKLLSALRAALAQRGGEVDVLDLVATPAPAFTPASMGAYYKRNYQGQPLSAEESAALAANDALIAQLKSADVVVLAHPMHNFGAPGPVKQWLDAVMFKDETFSYAGASMAGRKALVLYTSGGRYDAQVASTQQGQWDTLTQLMKISFGFMGFDAVEVLSAALLNPATAEANLAAVTAEIEALVARWY